MQTLTLLVTMIALLGVVPQAPKARPTGDETARSQAQAETRAKYARFPLSFEANQGQTDPRVKFLSRGEGYTLFLTSQEAVLTLSKPPQAENHRQHSSASTSVLRMGLAGANPEARVAGEDELAAKTNYFLGNDPAQWRADVPNYARVRYRDVYPGVDLIFYGSQGRLEYDFVVASKADPRVIKLDISGLSGRESARIDEHGDLLMQTRAGDVWLGKPAVYQLTKDTKNQVEKRFIGGRYVLRTSNFKLIKSKLEVGFEVEDFDRSKPLIIDPVLSYSTFVGGSAFDIAAGAAVDSSGNAVVVGYTTSTNFPTTNQSIFGGGVDAFVTKLNAAGSALVYSTYLGGSGTDLGSAVAVDNLGNAYVTGWTTSTNFPILNAVQQTFGGGGSDAFVTKLSSTGSMVYSTYLGGSGNEKGSGIAVDSAGNAYVAGTTSSVNFPMVKAVQSTSPGLPDAFVTELSNTGSAIVFSTFLGGSSADQAFAISVDGTGKIYVTGDTFSSDFPLKNALTIQVAANHAHAWVAKLDPSISNAVYSTYLGGSGDDHGYGIAADASGNAYVAGNTSSTNFPITTGAYQATFNGGLSDAFVTKLNPQGGLGYSTFLGGSGDDGATAIAVDASGDAFVTGSTNSTNFPILNAVQSMYGGGQSDGFVAEVMPGGSGLLYSTYLGGTNWDNPTGIAIDSAGNAYVAGSTASTNFPTTAGAFQTLHQAGFLNVFVAKVPGIAAPPPPPPPPPPNPGDGDDDDDNGQAGEHGHHHHKKPHSGHSDREQHEDGNKDHDRNKDSHDE